VLDKDGRAVERRIEIGLDDKITTEIRFGLEKGERVVVKEASPVSAPSAGPGGGGPPPMGL
jgi:macrolide-specific efflux system membrane fusion protein